MKAETRIEVPEEYAPRPLTLRQNVVLTLKVFGGFGLLGAALWVVSLWTTAK